jgi:glycosylphosphatidylinositol transamidase (GPIT) subunit GPI8
MIKFFVGLLACLVIVANCDEGVNWALLVAGSNEYYNYRHQVIFYTSIDCTQITFSPINLKQNS